MLYDRRSICGGEDLLMLVLLRLSFQRPSITVLPPPRCSPITQNAPVQASEAAAKGPGND